MTAIASIDSVSVNWAVVVLTAKSSWMNGIAGMNEDIASGPSAVASTSDTISVTDDVADGTALGAAGSARLAADARALSWFTGLRVSRRKGKQCTRLSSRSPRGLVVAGTLGLRDDAHSVTGGAGCILYMSCRPC